jgi:hypothetical protein
MAKDRPDFVIVRLTQFGCDRAGKASCSRCAKAHSFEFTPGEPRKSRRHSTGDVSSANRRSMASCSLSLSNRTTSNADLISEKGRKDGSTTASTEICGPQPGRLADNSQAVYGTAVAGASMTARPPKMNPDNFVKITKNYYTDEQLANKGHELPDDASGD